jgi:hypothetical protein
VTPIFYFILLNCLMKNICCLIFHLNLPFALLKKVDNLFSSQTTNMTIFKVFTEVTRSIIIWFFKVKILKPIWTSNFQSSLRIIFIILSPPPLFQKKKNLILIKVLDSNDCNAHTPQYTIVWDWIISVRCSLIIWIMKL